MSLTNETLRTRVGLWLRDEPKCLAEYGHISNWDTSKVTDMIHMFKGSNVDRLFNIQTLCEAVPNHKYNNYHRRKPYLLFLKQSGYIYDPLVYGNESVFNKLFDVEDMHRHIATFI